MKKALIFYIRFDSLSREVQKRPILTRHLRISAVQCTLQRLNNSVHEFKEVHYGDQYKDRATSLYAIEFATPLDGSPSPLYEVASLEIFLQREGGEASSKCIKHGEIGVGPLSIQAS